MLRTDHPLLDGLEGLWLPVHGRQGGSRLYDLSAYGRHGDLRNMNAATDWITEPEVSTPALDFSSNGNAYTDTGIQPANVPVRTVAVYYKLGSTGERRHGCWDSNDDRCYLGMWNGNNTMIWGAGTDFMPGQASIPAEGTIITLVGTVDDDGGEARLYLDGQLDNTSTAPSVPSVTENFYWGARRDDTGVTTPCDGPLYCGLISSQPWHESKAALFDREARRGFPDLLPRRESALYVSAAGAVTKTVAHDAGATRSSTLAQTIAAPVTHATPASRAQTAAKVTAITATHDIPLGRSQTGEKTVGLATVHDEAPGRSHTADKGFSVSIVHDAASERAGVADKAVSLAVAHGEASGRAQVVDKGMGLTVTHDGVSGRSHAIQKNVTATQKTVTAATASDRSQVAEKTMSLNISHDGASAHSATFDHTIAVSVSHDSSSSRASSFTQTITGQVIHDLAAGHNSTEAKTATVIVLHETAGETTIVGVRPSDVGIIELVARYDPDVTLIAVWNKGVDLNARLAHTTGGFNAGFSDGFETVEIGPIELNARLDK